MPLTEEMKRAIISISRWGGTNMFQTNNVKLLAETSGHPEVSRYIDENPQGYFNFIMFGDENKEA